MVSFLSDALEAAERMGSPLWNHPMLYVQWGAVLGTSLVAALIDIRTRRIPNLLTFPSLVAGVVCAAVIGGFGGLLDSVFGCLLLATPFVVLFLFAGGGAGDAKLMGALGAWLGIASGIVALVAVLATGAVIGLCYALSKKRLTRVLKRVGEMGSQWLLGALLTGRVRPLGASSPKQEEMLAMPYGVSIFSGVTLAATVVLVWHS